MDTETFLSRHEKVVLQLSSGKDSAACLYLLEPWWDRIDVVWGNPGNPYTETVEYMRHIASMVPRFFEVKGNQPDFVARHGMPVDFAISTHTCQRKLVPFWDCCAENLWKPVWEFIKTGGYTGIIRGQKFCDSTKPEAVSGTIENGIELYCPLENWSDLQVVDFLGDRLPISYKRGLQSSLECRDCSAYVSESIARIAELEYLDPESYKRVKAAHAVIMPYVRKLTEDLGGLYAHQCE